MLVPSTLLIRSLIEQLSTVFANDMGEAALGQSATAALRLLEVRERGGAVMVADRAARLTDLLTKLRPIVPDDAAEEIADLHASLAASAPGTTMLADGTARLEKILARTAAVAGLGEQERLALIGMLAEWEVPDRRSLTGDAAAPAADASEISAAGFEAYLRDRFAEPELRVTGFRPLPGGFGKQTILVQVAGEAIDGGIVIRRDPVTPTVDNDCHKVATEYPVMRATFDRGFPAPDALWIDTEHRLLPGPHFLVMRMSPGRTGGNVFGSSEAVSPALLDVLATGCAKLHTLPPCTELGDLTASIRADAWHLPIGETTRRYVTDWRDLYLANTHNPSPTLMTLYGWMLENVPDAPGRPVLVHGDVGFHNMLIDEGRLSALVDWEFAHVGDPAEDMGSIRNVVGDAAWEEIATRYVAAGGPEIDAARLHYFRVWQHVRNASASNLAMGKFQTGEIPDLKLAYTGHYHFPLFINAAWQLIRNGPGGIAVTVDY